MTPLVVIEGPALAFDRAVHEIEATGGTTESGFGPPYRAGAVVRTGTVDTPEDAGAALLAALAGQGLVIRVTAERAVIDRLVDDLRRLGPVEHRSGDDAAPLLGTEARAILGLLAEGHSLGEAAAILGLSRRTADRRLAEGRRALGVERTTEAIAQARRLGWLRRGATGA